MSVIRHWLEIVLGHIKFLTIRCFVRINYLWGPKFLLDEFSENKNQLLKKLKKKRKEKQLEVLFLLKDHWSKILLTIKVSSLKFQIYGLSSRGGISRNDLEIIFELLEIPSQQIILNREFFLYMKASTQTMNTKYIFKKFSFKF